ncbi:MAG: protein kinase [Clostridiales bacterium]|nr:protein kinase [Clostridiales bacterium]
MLGEGHNGIVYLLPDGKAIKIFKDKKHCVKEYDILKAVNGNKYFPKVYSCGGNYIIRDFVGGECAKDYIKKKGLSKKLALNLIHLLEEFINLKFTRIDIRCRDLYIQDDESILVIDPKSSFSRNIPFPRHLSKGLKKLKVLDKFLKILKQENGKLYDDWVPALKKCGLLQKCH